MPLPPTPPSDGPATQDPAADATTVAASRPVTAAIQQDASPLLINGISASKARALFGQPATRVSAGPRETWTYRSGSCEVELYLFPDVSHGGLHVLDHQTSATDGEQACLRRLTDGHDN